MERKEYLQNKKNTTTVLTGFKTKRQSSKVNLHKGK